MNSQFKKGFLRLTVLLFLKSQDSYGYDLVRQVGEIFNTPAGTIYPILYKLTDDELVDTYLQESNEGGVRKYYKLNQKGFEILQKEFDEWDKFTTSYQSFVDQYR
jgi:PadR family transcriptional regulator, regulatory protein PadR